MPFSEYARRYTPTDRMGFGATSARPTDMLSAQLVRYEQLERRMHERFTLATIGSTIANRVAMITAGTWYYAGLPVILLLAAPRGLPRNIFRLALGTAIAVFAAFLSYGHVASWILYYVEIQAPLAFLTAVGVFVVADYLSRRFARAKTQGTREQLYVRRLLVLVSGILLLAPAAAEARASRDTHIADRALVDAFDEAIRALPQRPAVVFVREQSDEHPERTVVDNVVDLNATPLWTVHDLGASNQKLMNLAPGRAFFRLDEARSNGSIRFRISELHDSLAYTVPTRGTTYFAATAPRR